MVALELSGALQNFKTFPLPLQRSKLRTSVLAYPNRQLLLGYIQGALAQRRYDLAFDLTTKLLVNYTRWGRKWLRQKVVKNSANRT